MSDRRSGRTTRQLDALPDGSYYLVANIARHGAHCLELLRELGRPRSAIRFVSADTNLNGLTGIRPTVWDVDHAYFEAGGHRARATYDFIYMAAGKPPLSQA